jgi:hypothetical protein
MCWYWRGVFIEDIAIYSVFVQRRFFQHKCDASILFLAVHGSVAFALTGILKDLDLTT